MSYFLSFQESSLWYTALTCNGGMSIVIWWCFYKACLLYSDKPYCIRRVTRCSYGTNCASYNKIIVIVFMSSFWSSFFSICDRSKVDFNCFIITSRSLKSLQEQFQNRQITKTKMDRCSECFWARCKQDNLEFFWSKTIS